MKLDDAVVKLSTDPFNPEYNFLCAKEYDRLNQTASAVSFYLRTAEYGFISHKYLAYRSLLRMSICFETQHDRVNTVSNCILQAVALYPERPEAYFLMARFYEKQGSWQECYTWASLGLTAAKKLGSDNQDVLLEYHYSISLVFEKAVSAWWIGRGKESKELFSEILASNLTTEAYRVASEGNMNRVNNVTV